MFQNLSGIRSFSKDQVLLILILLRKPLSNILREIVLRNTDLMKLYYEFISEKHLTYKTKMRIYKVSRDKYKLRNRYPD